MTGTPELGRQAAFVWAAYGVTLVVLASLIVDTWLRARRWKREANRIERERDSR